MIEIPESNTLANQINETIKGKKIVSVITNSYPHKFTFFYEDPNIYNDLLKGKIIGESKAYGGQIKISLENKSNVNSSNKNPDNQINDNEVMIVLGEDINIRYVDKDDEIPEKHQLLIKFDDSSAFVLSARMYAQIHVALSDHYDNEYYDVAKEKPSPLSDEFDMKYFEYLLGEVRPTITLKSFLATKQRIPGLGNGTLQDILFNAKLHPKTKIKKLSKDQKKDLFDSIKNTLNDMVENGGRSTEKTLFGNQGDYQVILSAKTFKDPCPSCGEKLIKESYLGGTIYYCPTCQELDV